MTVSRESQLRARRDMLTIWLGPLAALELELDAVLVKSQHLLLRFDDPAEGRVASSTNSELCDYYAPAGDRTAPL